MKKLTDKPHSLEILKNFKKKVYHEFIKYRYRSNKIYVDVTLIYHLIPLNIFKYKVKIYKNLHKHRPYKIPFTAERTIDSNES